MYELNKIAFGSFLAQLRREKGMTQKELAACLYVSDKAVSKWERGLSVPDISLLVPLAEQLNVTVAELLQGCRVEEEQRFTREETEELIRKALTFSAEPPERRQARTQKLSSLVPKIVSWKRLVKIGSRRLEQKVLREFSQDFFVAQKYGADFGRNDNRTGLDKNTTTQYNIGNLLCIT